MKISYHIFNLLQEHDCVIVPNFGAFVARNISAKISRDGSRIYPPNKEITFNKSLIKSDGLLINRISSDENIRQSGDRWDFTAQVTDDNKTATIRDSGGRELSGATTPNGGLVDVIYEGLDFEGVMHRQVVATLAPVCA